MMSPFDQTRSLVNWLRVFLAMTFQANPATFEDTGLRDAVEWIAIAQELRSQADTGQTEPNSLRGPDADELERFERDTRRENYAP